MDFQNSTALESSMSLHTSQELVHLFSDGCWNIDMKWTNEMRNTSSVQRNSQKTLNWHNEGQSWWRRRNHWSIRKNVQRIRIQEIVWKYWESQFEIGLPNKTWKTINKFYYQEYQNTPYLFDVCWMLHLRSAYLIFKWL